MSKFKKGQRVQVNDWDSLSGRILTVKDGPVGTGSGGNYYFEEIDEPVLGDHLELATKTIDNLEVGDVLVREEWHDLIVQGTIREIVFVVTGDKSRQSYDYSVTELKNNGWKLKDSEEITELTLEEVAELKGIPVEKLRIKDK